MIIKGCTGKQAYLSYEDALAHLKSLVWFNACRRRERLSKGLNIYRCDSCDNWHVGHRRPDLVWHYTTGQCAPLIFADGFMRPWGWTRNAARRVWDHRAAARLYDRVPLLWFSRNQIYEPTARKGLATPAGVVWLTESQTEIFGSGLFRFGVDASVLPLRWYDHVELNRVPRRPARVAIATVRRAGNRVGRNEVCACRSGRKYKRCCGAAAISRKESASWMKSHVR